MNEMKHEGVMRALECCQASRGFDCWACPYDGTERCDKLKADALALLREKDAEIEHLKTREKVLTQMLDDGYNEWEDYVRADAITEFAERLTGRFNLCDKAMYSQTTVHDVIAHIEKKMKEQNDET